MSQGFFRKSARQKRLLSLLFCRGRGILRSTGAAPEFWLKENYSYEIA